MAPAAIYGQDRPYGAGLATAAPFSTPQKAGTFGRQPTEVQQLHAWLPYTSELQGPGASTNCYGQMKTPEATPQARAGAPMPAHYSPVQQQRPGPSAPYHHSNQQDSRWLQAYTPVNGNSTGAFSSFGMQPAVHNAAQMRHIQRELEAQRNLLLSLSRRDRQQGVGHPPPAPQGLPQMYGGWEENSQGSHSRGEPDSLSNSSISPVPAYPTSQGSSWSAMSHGNAPASKPQTAMSQLMESLGRATAAPAPASRDHHHAGSLPDGEAGARVRRSESFSNSASLSSQLEPTQRRTVDLPGPEAHQQQKTLQWEDGVTARGRPAQKGKASAELELLRKQVAGLNMRLGALEHILPPTPEQQHSPLEARQFVGLLSPGPTGEASATTAPGIAQRQVATGSSIEEALRKARRALESEMKTQQGGPDVNSHSGAGHVRLSGMSHTAQRVARLSQHMSVPPTPRSQSGQSTPSQPRSSWQGDRPAFQAHGSPSASLQTAEEPLKALLPLWFGGDGGSSNAALSPGSDPDARHKLLALQEAIQTAVAKVAVHEASRQRPSEAARGQRSADGRVVTSSGTSPTARGSATRGSEASAKRTAEQGTAMTPQGGRQAVTPRQEEGARKVGSKRGARSASSSPSRPRRLRDDTQVQALLEEARGASRAMEAATAFVRSNSPGRKQRRQSPSSAAPSPSPWRSTPQAAEKAPQADSRGRTSQPPKSGGEEQRGCSAKKKPLALQLEASVATAQSPGITLTPHRLGMPPPSSHSAGRSPPGPVAPSFPLPQAPSGVFSADTSVIVPAPASELSRSASEVPADRSQQEAETPGQPRPLPHPLPTSPPPPSAASPPPLSPPCSSSPAACLAAPSTTPAAPLASPAPTTSSRQGDGSECSPGVGDMTFDELREQAAKAELAALKELLAEKELEIHDLKTQAGQKPSPNSEEGSPGSSKPSATAEASVQAAGSPRAAGHSAHEDLQEKVAALEALLQSKDAALSALQASQQLLHTQAEQSRAEAAEAQRLLSESSDKIDHMAALKERLKHELDSTRSSFQEARWQLQRERESSAASASSALTAKDSEIQTLREALEAAQAQVGALGDAVDQLEAQLDRTRAEADSAHAEAEGLRAEAVRAAEPREVEVDGVAASSAAEIASCKLELSLLMQSIQARLGGGDPMAVLLEGRGWLEEGEEQWLASGGTAGQPVGGQTLADSVSSSAEQIKRDLAALRDVISTQSAESMGDTCVIC